MIRHQLERLMADRDSVPREEFEAVKAMAAAAREENEILKSRIAALEARSAGPAPAAKAAPKPKRKPGAGR